MHIINPRSNLTPQPRIDGRNGYANASGEKATFYRDDKARGLSEHRTMLNMPYFSANHNW